MWVTSGNSKMVSGMCACGISGVRPMVLGSGIVPTSRIGDGESDAHVTSGPQGPRGGDVTRPVRALPLVYSCRVALSNDVSSPRQPEDIYLEKMASRHTLWCMGPITW